MAGTPGLPMRWMFFAGGLFSGAVPLWLVNTEIERRQLHWSMQNAIRNPLSLLQLSAMLAVVVWLAGEGFGLLTPMAEILSNGLLDLTSILGVGHLLLKRASSKEVMTIARAEAIAAEIAEMEARAAAMAAEARDAVTELSDADAEEQLEAIRHRLCGSTATVTETLTAASVPPAGGA
eukprot:gnl/TRDRNA2_/TRDRNA2_139650_c1_seq1.p1 gnl/TRDRNA2_/TRDRNA2_139650_c1~~gnl/TRDRNA2_/TRDRNA2_139650_c1_seq1.p1  ORF type:complete len:201 (-),score=38.67 gnl/TRDRNA2_/TRDRNA2_139650_c1_seq1:55-588(-)